MSAEELDFTVDPAYIVQGALLFPCFGDADPEKGVQKLFKVIMDAYHDGNLTEEQELVVELFLHLSDASAPFNLKRALEIWSDKDLKAFIARVKARD